MSGRIHTDPGVVLVSQREEGEAVLLSSVWGCSADAVGICETMSKC